jgi:hypothetical protein
VNSASLSAYDPPTALVGQHRDSPRKLQMEELSLEHISIIAVKLQWVQLPFWKYTDHE